MRPARMSNLAKSSNVMFSLALGVDEVDRRHLLHLVGGTHPAVLEAVQVRQLRPADGILPDSFQPLRLVVVQRNGNHLQSLCRQAVVMLVQFPVLRPARRTPRRPEVHQHILPPEIRQRHLPPLLVRQRKGRRLPRQLLRLQTLIRFKNGRPHLALRDILPQGLNSTGKGLVIMPVKKQMPMDDLQSQLRSGKLTDARQPEIFYFLELPRQQCTAIRFPLNCSNRVIPIPHPIILLLQQPFLLLISSEPFFKRGCLPTSGKPPYQQQYVYHFVHDSYF